MAGWDRNFEIFSWDSLYRIVLDINLPRFDDLLHSSRWPDVSVVAVGVILDRQSLQLAEGENRHQMSIKELLLFFQISSSFLSRVVLIIIA